MSRAPVISFAARERLRTVLAGEVVGPRSIAAGRYINLTPGVSMSRIRYQVAMSLDGYIAGPAGDYDWITADPAIDFGAMFARYDTFVLGRRTYELTLQPGNPGFATGTRAYVFSRTLPDEVPGFTVVREVSPESVAPIRAQAKKDIWLFGGGELFRHFLRLGLVDTVEVAVMPTLLGEGIQLLPQPASRARLRLTNQRTYPSGIVLLEYAVLTQAA